MIHLLSKTMTHHAVMTSSLCFQNCKIDKFGDFSSDIDYNSKQMHSEISSL